MLIKRIILASLLILFFSSVYAAVSNIEKIEINFFYGDGCSHCKNVESFLDKLEKKYNNILVNRLEIWNNEKNVKTYRNFKVKYNVESSGVPVLFIGNDYFLGDTLIFNNLENKILEISRKKSILSPFKKDNNVPLENDITNNELNNDSNGELNINAKQDSTMIISVALLAVLLVLCSAIYWFYLKK